MSSVNPINFDGASYLTMGALSGVVDGKSLTGALYFQTTQTGTPNILHSQFGRTRWRLNNGTMELWLRESSGNGVVEVLSTIAVNDGLPHKIVFSFDATDPTKRHFQIDDVERGNWTTYNDALIDFTRNTHGFGSTQGGASIFNGDLGDFLLCYNRYHDLSIESERLKFSGPDYAVDHGPDGSDSLGYIPDFWLTGDLDTWHLNQGGAGGWTENGTLLQGSANFPPYGPISSTGNPWWHYRQMGA